MPWRYNANSFQNQSYYTNNNEERFIWPLIPFLGGAAIGYIAGRPQYNYTYPNYNPIYYPVYYPVYYNRPYTNTSYSTTNYQ